MKIQKIAIIIASICFGYCIIYALFFMDTTSGEKTQETESITESTLTDQYIAPCGHMYMPSEFALCDTCAIDEDEYVYN